jgi:SsrA-binding protein
MAKNKEHKPKKIEVVNRKAEYEYHFLSKFEAGMILTGTEIKSIREGGNVNMSDAFCMMRSGELWVKNLFIAEYSHGSYNNHETRRLRKLLLKKQELDKIQKKIKEKGFTVIPYRLYVNERGLAKIEVNLAQGKKSYDKRASIKEKDQKRELERIKRIR